MLQLFLTLIKCFDEISNNKRPTLEPTDRLALQAGIKGSFTGRGEIRRYDRDKSQSLDSAQKCTGVKSQSLHNAF